jgi:mRNA interferase RelE/StbE
MYRVVLQSQPRRFFADADRPLARKLARAFRILERNPRGHPNIKPLSGDLAGLLRFRAGDHRIVYSVDDEARSVHVLLIAHRRDAYR